MRKGYFITGTDTGVGKTWVSMALMGFCKQKGLSVVGMKPVAAGCELQAGEWVNDDALLLQRQGSVELPYSRINPYALREPVSPHIAARREHRHIRIDKLVMAYDWLASSADCVIVEGAGGWLVPLNDEDMISGLAEKIGLPIVMVVGLKLGCLNHAQLTMAGIRVSNLKCAGWVGSVLDPEMPFLEENIATLKKKIEAPCLGILPYMANFDEARALSALSLNNAMLDPV